MKRGASIRKTYVILKREQFTSSKSSVHRTTKKLHLEWYKKRKSQKLTDVDKLKRIKYAKRLRKKFGVWKNSKDWKWNRVVNCDFSGLFPLQGFHKRRNDSVWTNEGEEIEADLINTRTAKFQKAVIFWGAISSQGLIPSHAPIDFTQWLEQQRTSSNEKRKRVYSTNQLYAKVVKEKVTSAIKIAFKKSKLDPIFHEDQDQKQRTRLVLNTVPQLFNERIQLSDGDAKFADVWRTENVWGALKEKNRGKVFTTSFELEQEIEKEWKKFSIEKCAKMMDDIPY